MSSSRAEIHVPVPPGTSAQAVFMQQLRQSLGLSSNATNDQILQRAAALVALEQQQQLGQ